MTPTEVLDALFAPLPELQRDGTVDVRSFLATHGPSAGGDEGPSYFARLVRVALHADRRSLASVAGHQAAIRRLFPSTPNGAVVAFCVSEDKGPRPSHIHTSLTEGDTGNFTMTGTKRWGSMAPVADLCYVAASVGRNGERNDLRMVAMPTNRPGVTLDLEPYESWGPEFQICDLHLSNVPLQADEVLPGDGYLNAIKPFRLVEDVYNTAGSLIGLFQLGRRHNRPTAQLESLVGLVVQAAAIAETDMASDGPVVLLSEFLGRADAAWSAFWADWSVPPESIAQGWTPERGLLGVAAAARETRLANAWNALQA